jgi:hypothetical protein
VTKRLISRPEEKRNYIAVPLLRVTPITGSSSEIRAIHRCNSRKSPYLVRVGLRYRALAVEVDDGCLWFWIGSHADYGKLIG